jgi:ubiquinone/menaquinone biosynthesis C-methylase UbiE
MGSWLRGGINWIGHYSPVKIPWVQEQREKDVSSGIGAQPRQSADVSITQVNGESRPVVAKSAVSKVIDVFDAIDILWQTGSLIALSGGPKSRQTAYYKASQYIEIHQKQWPQIATEKLQGEVGITEEVIQAITALQCGDLPDTYIHLRSELGEDAAELLRVKGIGPKLAQTIQKTLNIWTLDQISRAADSGLLLQVKGIGPRMIDQLKQMILEAQEQQHERQHLRSLCGGPRSILSGIMRFPMANQSLVINEDEIILQPNGYRHPIHDGVIDLPFTSEHPPSLLNKIMDNPLYSRFHDGFVRPGLLRLISKRDMAYYQNLQLKLLDLKPDWKVLDVFCGTGQLTRAIASLLEPKMGVAIGVDLHWSMLSHAAAHQHIRHFPNLFYVRGDIQRLPFQDQTLDAIVCTTALHLLADPERLLNDFFRITRPQGKLVISTFLQSHSLPFRLIQLYGSLITGVRWFSLEQLQNVIQTAGYYITQIKIDELMVSIAASKA